MDGCLSATHSSIILSCSYIEHQPIISRLQRGADATCQVFTENLTQHLHSLPPPIRALGNVVKRSLMTCARISVLPVPFDKKRQDSIALCYPPRRHKSSTPSLHIDKIYFSTYLQNTLLHNIFLFLKLKHICYAITYFINASTSCSQSAVFPSTVFLCIWISSSFSLSDEAASAFIRLSFMWSP